MTGRAIFHVSTDVSNAANGGQILMDEPTFTAVKESIHRLGLVTASGLDYRRLYATPGSSSSKPTLGSVLANATAECVLACCVCQTR